MDDPFYGNLRVILENNYYFFFFFKSQYSQHVQELFVWRQKLELLTVNSGFYIIHCKEECM